MRHDDLRAQVTAPHCDPLASETLRGTAGDAGGGWQGSGVSAGDNMSAASGPLQQGGSSAADMARQLAMGGMTTDALLEALASLPKVRASLWAHKGWWCPAMLK